MSIYLNWRLYSPTSKERFITNLFSHLSPRWYPVNIIGSTVYDIFDAYGDQLSSSSVEINQVFKDLTVEEVRTTVMNSRTTTKIYDNFGSIINLDKYFYQNYDYYNIVYDLQSYREQLRLLFEAYGEGASEMGVFKAVQSYTGISPLIIEHTKFDENTWKLGSTTGSIVEMLNNNTSIMLDTYISDVRGYITPINDKTFVPSGSNFLVTNKVTYSRSKLNTNTKLGGRGEFYQNLEFIVYGNSFITSQLSFQNSILKLIKQTIKVDQIPIISYSNKYEYYRPSIVSSSGSQYLGYSDYEGVYSLQATPYSGIGIIGGVLELPNDRASYDWYYDWLVLQRNDSQYLVQVRSYPTSSIPDTVYFQSITSLLIERLPASSSVIREGGHWVFDRMNKIWDISGNFRNLSLISTPSIFTTFIDGRDSRWKSINYTSDSVYFTGSVPEGGNLGNSFYCEMWMKGVDETSSGKSGYVFYKLESTPSVTHTWPIIGNGIRCGIDFLNSQMSFYISSGSYSKLCFYDLSSDVFLEKGSRYHYFAFTYSTSNDGSLYILYRDGQIMSSGSTATGSLLGISIPVLSSISSRSTFGCKTETGMNIAVDEMTFGSGFLDPVEASARFISTKPRINTLQIPSSSVDLCYQPKVIFYAKGSKELEFHQFSMRGTQKRNINSKVGYYPVEVLQPIPFITYELISTYCSNYDLWGIYKDSLGNTLTRLIEENSTACGYLPFGVYNFVVGNIDTSTNSLQATWYTPIPTKSYLVWGTDLLTPNYVYATGSWTGNPIVNISSGVLDNTYYSAQVHAWTPLGITAISEIENFLITNQIYRILGETPSLGSSVVTQTSSINKVISVSGSIQYQTDVPVTEISGSIESTLFSVSTGSVDSVINMSGSISNTYSTVIS